MVLLFLNNNRAIDLNLKNTKCRNAKQKKYKIGSQVDQLKIPSIETQSTIHMKWVSGISATNTKYTKHKTQAQIQNWVPGTCHPSTSSLPRAFYFHGKPGQQYVSMRHGTIVHDIAHLTMHVRHTVWHCHVLSKMSCVHYFCS